MTNGEHYAEKLIDFACGQGPFAVRQDGRLVRCSEIRCAECSFNTPGNCSSHRRVWIRKEYAPIIDWAKVPVDTKVLTLTQDLQPQWVKEHFAKYEDGMVFTFPQGATSWSYRSRYDLIPWRQVKLADPEDIEKYQIKE